MNRFEFLRLLGLGATVLPFTRPWQPMWAAALQPAPSPRLLDLVAGSFVMDGNANLGTRRGNARSSLAPGEIIRLTGIKVGNHTVRPPSLQSMSRLFSDHPESLLRIDRAPDLERAWKSGLYGAAFYLQSGFDLQGSVEPLSQWKEEGLRVMQITYQDSELGGGSSSDRIPLSPLGHRVVKELNRLRMVVDVSHSGRRTTLDVAHASSAPITANHANVARLTPHNRNKSDEELMAIANTGGVVGITNINRYFLTDPSRPGSLDDFVAHLDYLVDKIGIDHVGISSDSYMDASNVYDVDYSTPMLNSYDRWRHVAQGLSDRGYSDGQLQKILGLNFKRVYEAVLDP